MIISLEDFGLKFAGQNLIHQHNNNIWWSFQRPKQPNHKLNDGCCDRGTVFFQSSTRIFEPFWDSIYRFFSDRFFEIPEILSTSGWLYIYVCLYIYIYTHLVINTIYIYIYIIMHIHIHTYVYAHRYSMDPQSRCLLRKHLPWSSPTHRTPTR